VSTSTGISGCLQPGQRVNAQIFFLALKSNQNTWFSATLDFSLVFPWFSAVSPTLCTVISKKTKLSYFGGFFSLVFKIQATAWFSWSCFMLKHGPNRNITFYLNIIKFEYSKEDIQTFQ
jgi:hypothetical protein